MPLLLLHRPTCRARKQAQVFPCIVFFTWTSKPKSSPRTEKSSSYLSDQRLFPWRGRKPRIAKNVPTQLPRQQRPSRNAGSGQRSGPRSRGEGSPAWLPPGLSPLRPRRAESRSPASAALQHRRARSSAGAGARAAGRAAPGAERSGSDARRRRRGGREDGGGGGGAPLGRGGPCPPGGGMRPPRRSPPAGVLWGGSLPCFSPLSCTSRPKFGFLSTRKLQVLRQSLNMAYRSDTQRNRF